MKVNTMEKSLDIKLKKTYQGNYNPSDFIIADAKDGDMGGGIKAFGQVPEDPSRSKSFPDHLDAMREMTSSKLIDVMLMSVSAAERLVNDDVFKNSAVTPAVRLNDTSDIWGPRGSKYKVEPAHNFRSARIDKVVPIVDLGLYSITFSNDLKKDLASLNEFHSFLNDISGKKLRYFLEVFNPQIDIGIDKENLPGYLKQWEDNADGVRSKYKTYEEYVVAAEQWKKDNLNDIRKRLTGWQLESFNESYEYKINNGISLFKKNLINE